MASSILRGAVAAAEGLTLKTLSASQTFCCTLLQQLSASASASACTVPHSEFLPPSCSQQLPTSAGSAVAGNAPRGRVASSTLLPASCNPSPADDGACLHGVLSTAGGLLAQRKMGLQSMSSIVMPSSAAWPHRGLSSSSASSSDATSADARKGFVRGGFTVDMFPPERIRNLCIIAHVDHGKSTLADRLMESCGAIAKGSQAQYLDKLQVRS